MLVGHGVPIAAPFDKTVNATYTIDHACGVVGVPRETDQMLALLGVPLKGCALVEESMVDNSIEPVDELRAHVGEVAKLSTVEEGPLELPEGPLDARLVIGVAAAHREGLKLIVGREGKEARVVDRLIALPPEHHWLLTVVFALPRAPIEAAKGLLVPIHQCMQIAALVESNRFSFAAYQDVGERLYDSLLRVREVYLVGGPVAFAHLAQCIVRCRHARRGSRRRAHCTHMFLHAGVPAIEALVLQDLEHAPRRNVGEARHQLRNARLPGVQFGRPRRSRRPWWDRDGCRLTTCLVGLP